MSYPFPGIDRTDFVADDHEPRPVPLSQLRGDQIYLVAHHAYARTLGQILATFNSPDRTVTANLAIGPLTAGVDDYVVSHTVEINTQRAYTTASSIDKVALTFEMANLSLEPPFPVGQTGKQILAELIAWLHVEYGMPIDREHVTCHREVYERGWGSYATACPGGDLHGALDWACEEARRIVAGVNNPDQEEDEMKPRQIHYRTATGTYMRAVLVPGTGYFVKWTESGATFANGIATGFETGSSTQVTASLFGVFERAALALAPRDELIVDIVDAEPVEGAA